MTEVRYLQTETRNQKARRTFSRLGIATTQDLSVNMWHNKETKPGMEGSGTKEKTMAYL